MSNQTQQTPGRLAERLTAARLTMREQNRVLRRARRLYVRLCRQAIALDRSGLVLEFCAGRMLDSGMYAQSLSRKHSEQMVRFSILRQMWRYDRAQKLSWHEWVLKNGWASYRWQRVKSAAA